MVVSATVRIDESAETIGLDSVGRSKLNFEQKHGCDELQRWTGC